ncbi:MAG: SdrD B-like domain-containing protein, partial [Aureliella sp.]
MGSFLDKLFGRISKSRKRTIHARRLRVESLERRQLMASDLGSITGTVYTDLTDNGLTGDDPRISGATVELYRDGGNGTFDSGGGDDVALPSTTTNASGIYTFDDLIAGTYFVQQAAVSGQVQRSSETVKTVTITAGDAAGAAGETIDSFSTDQSVTSTSVGVADSNAVAAAEALGGQRELFAELGSGTSIDLIANTATAGILEFNAAAGSDGSRLITYDGLNESDASVVDGTGLGGVDLTNAGANLAFRLTMGADQSATNVIIRVYSTATDYSTITVPIDNTGGAATGTLIARFADFTTGGGTGADFTNINAIQLELDTGDANGQIDLFETVGRSVATSNIANLNAMSIGNLVWSDVDNDGVKDAGESGIAGVSVELYSDTNTNGSYDSGVDTLVGTQTTDASGNYLFDDLLPGDYIAVIPASQFIASAPLFGYVTSSGNDPAPDPDGDIDDDDNGAVVGSVVATAALTLVAGGEPTTDGDTDTNSNLTLDFGFVPQVDISLVKSDAPDPVVPGSQLTYTLALSNDGAISATNVVATDTLPSGTTFVS